MTSRINEAAFKETCDTLCLGRTESVFAKRVIATYLASLPTPQRPDDTLTIISRQGLLHTLKRMRPSDANSKGRTST